MPVVVAGVPPWRWVLDDAARAAAANLATRLPVEAVVVSSTEPKATATAHAIAAHGDRAVATDSGFAEVHRPGGFDPDYRATAAAYLDGADHPAGGARTRHHGRVHTRAGADLTGWEPRAAVVARFSAAIARHRVDGGDLVVATHGMAMSLWAAHVTGADDVVALWRGLRFPDVVTVAVD